MKIKKLYRGFKRFYVKWKKQRIQTTGYQIIYSRSKKFSKAKVKTVRSNRYTGTNIKRLKRYKRYYVKVKTYKTVSSKKFYSGWSKDGRGLQAHCRRRLRPPARAGLLQYRRRGGPGAPRGRDRQGVSGHGAGGVRGVGVRFERGGGLPLRGHRLRR